MYIHKSRKQNTVITIVDQYHPSFRFYEDPYEQKNGQNPSGKVLNNE